MNQPSPHAQETIGLDEPVGGWVTAPTLADSEILSIVLCRYTGAVPYWESGLCPQRQLAHHPDTECRTLYHQQEALANGRIHYEMTASEVTVSAGGDDPTYVHPLT